MTTHFGNQFTGALSLRHAIVRGRPISGTRAELGDGIISRVHLCFLDNTYRRNRRFDCAPIKNPCNVNDRLKAYIRPRSRMRITGTVEKRFSDCAENWHVEQILFAVPALACDECAISAQTPAWTFLL